MGFVNEFLNKMKLVSDTDDDYDEYDEYQDDDEDDIYTAPKKEKKSGMFKKSKKAEPDETVETDEADSPYSAPSPYSSSSSYTQKAAPEPIQKSPRRRSVNSTPNNVVDMRSAVSAAGSSEVCLIVPKDFDDANEIADILLAKKSVVLNLEGLNIDAAQRIIDFTSGACYAVNGNLKKVSKKIFLATPSNVILSGDFIELENGETIDLNSLNLMR